MRILIVGGGGREHALAWKIIQSDQVEKLYIAPGNAGTATEKKACNIAIDIKDIDALCAFATQQHIGLTIVGPEAPLVAGIVDAFQAAGLACFGPTRAAAILEGSKSFTKAFLKRHGIPTANYASCTDIDSAIDYLDSINAPFVVKADGLAAGKGVTIAKTRAHAIAAIQKILQDDTLAAAQRQVVIEEFLTGEEVSFIVVSDGKRVLPLASTQDHKARDAGDKGPNTGGMGAYSPVTIMDDVMQENVMQRIILPTINGMALENRHYVGFLYAGLMIGDDGIARVLEFNCRLGDPETQPIMMRLQSDLVSLCTATINGKLDQYHIEWDARAALGVVMAAAGYPASVSTGDIIHGLTDATLTEQVKVFHAGTKMNDNHVVTNGGRVLCVTALGETIANAQQKAYTATKKIHFDGMFYRSDIGHRAR